MPTSCRCAAGFLGGTFATLRRKWSFHFISLLGSPWGSSLELLMLIGTIFLQIHAYLHTLINTTYKHIHIHTELHTCRMHAHAHGCMHGMHACMHKHIYTHTYIHTYIHSYIHRMSPRCSWGCPYLAAPAPDRAGFRIWTTRNTTNRLRTMIFDDFRSGRLQPQIGLVSGSGPPAIPPIVSER